MALVASSGVCTSINHGIFLSRLQSGSHASSSPRCSAAVPSFLRKFGGRQETAHALLLRQEWWSGERHHCNLAAFSSKVPTGSKRLRVLASASVDNVKPTRENDRFAKADLSALEPSMPDCLSEIANARPDAGPISALMDTGEKIFYDFDVETPDQSLIDDELALDEEPEEGIEDLLAGLDGTTVIEELKEEEDIDRRFKKTRDGREVSDRDLIVESLCSSFRNHGSWKELMPGVLERRASVSYIANCSHSLHGVS
jgi:hypothetical protein